MTNHQVYISFLWDINDTAHSKQVMGNGKGKLLVGNG